MTRIIRHRYEGDSLGLCAVELPDGKGACGLAPFGSWHYSDQDHPYTARGDGLGPCEWGLMSGDGLGTCSRTAGASEHQRAYEEMQQAQEAGVFRVRPPAPGKQGYGYPPDEDQIAAAPASASDSAGEKPKPSVWSAFGEPPKEKSPAEMRAEFWVGGEEVGPGPWPVRQWVQLEDDDGARGGFLAAQASLLSLGVAYDAYAWWQDGGLVLRLVWGSAYGLQEGEVAAALRNGTWG